MSKTNLEEDEWKMANITTFNVQVVVNDEQLALLSTVADHEGERLNDFIQQQVADAWPMVMEHLNEKRMDEDLEIEGFLDRLKDPKERCANCGYPHGEHTDALWCKNFLLMGTQPTRKI